MKRTLIAACLAFALCGPAFAQSAVSGQTNPWPVSKVIGLTVFNGQGEQIGKIADLIMDPQSQITTAIISVGGVATKYIAVGLETIRFPAATNGGQKTSPYPEKAVLSVSKSTLDGLPSFNY